MNLILISNLEKVLSSNRNFKKNLRVTQTKKNKILFIPSTPSEKVITKKNVLKTLNCFSEHFINFDSYEILDYEADIVTIKENINDYSVIFVMGGDTKIQNMFLHTIEFRETFNRYRGNIIGMSAGAINLCRISFLNKKHDHDEMSSLMLGMSLLKNVSVDVHFDIKDLAQINELSINKLPVYCIPDQSALIINEYVEFVNDIYVYSKNILKKVH